MLDNIDNKANNELMLKKLFAGISAGLFTLIFAGSAFAASLAVTSIGALDTSATFYSAWWYTSENPTLGGTAGESASVTIDIDGTVSTVNADAAGNWSFAPTTLTNGEHTVTITSGAENVTFKITIGSTVPADLTSGTASTAPATLPDSGMGSATIFLAIAGLLGLGFGAYNFVFAKES